ncbi:hypothetical protein TrispH2_006518 [Trichoplax sp. H2]|nr:hypothetical protein TrispH2_006518 [Trichoplax sp. H2]|eukprot:RDD42349.1 hypothetical protein TrispH2_006518 [Trichoplax sp. H2]
MANPLPKDSGYYEWHSFPKVMLEDSSFMTNLASNTCTSDTPMDLSEQLIDKMSSQLSISNGFFHPNQLRVSLPGFQDDIPTAADSIASKSRYDGSCLTRINEEDDEIEMSYADSEMEDLEEFDSENDSDDNSYDPEANYENDVSSDTENGEESDAASETGTESDGSLTRYMLNYENIEDSEDEDSDLEFDADWDELESDNDSIP